MSDMSECDAAAAWRVWRRRRARSSSSYTSPLSHVRPVEKHTEPQSSGSEMSVNNSYTDGSHGVPDGAGVMGKAGQDGSLDAQATATLSSILYPDDSYTSDGVYWASLPFGQKMSFINKQSNAEAKRELGVIGRMFRADPLEPFRAYGRNYCITGMGLFVEGWVLFSVGNLKPLFQIVWPECWKTHEVCDKNWISAVDYLQIIGIIVGQILVGIEGDWIGRRFGMVQDAIVMTLGSVALTAMWGTSLNNWVILYAWVLFVYGVGVGGEYPMTSTAAMEKSTVGSGATQQDRLHRGRNVGLAFLMQGWGQLVQLSLLIILILIFNNGRLNGPISEMAGQYAFRLQFAFVIFPTLWLAYHRYYRMSYSADHALKEAKGRLNTSGYDVKSLKLAIGHYWHRLVGTAIAWFCNDTLFYGSKIFQGVFVRVISGSDSLQTTYKFSVINVVVSLAGYYMGALLLDTKAYGRKWIQINGLAVIFILFLLSAIFYPELTTTKYLKIFQAMYFFSSFATQFGPNITSFLLAAEVYPASIRATAHGVSAATGKLGALLPAVLYNYIDNRTKFWFVCWFGLVGALLTYIFVPEVTALDLREQERYWWFVTNGREKEYHGVAVHPQHLSLWERVVLKRHLAYDPVKDAQQKIDELQEVYESTQNPDSEGGNRELTDDQKAFLQTNDLTSYFASRKKLESHVLKQPNPTHKSALADLEGKLQ